MSRRLARFPKSARTIARTVLDVAKKYKGQVLRECRWPRAARTQIRKRFPDAKFSNGSYKSVVIFPKRGFVVKVGVFLEREYKIIRSFRKIRSVRRHFPHAELFRHAGMIAEIQELIGLINKRLPKGVRVVGKRAEDITGELGICDMHEENFGYVVQRQKAYPVLVDVSND